MRDNRFKTVTWRSRWRVLSRKSLPPRPKRLVSLPCALEVRQQESANVSAAHCFPDRLRRTIQKVCHSRVEPYSCGAVDQGFIPNTSFLLVQLTTHVPRSRRRCSPALAIDVQNVSRYIVRSQRWTGIRCESRRGPALSPPWGGGGCSRGANPSTLFSVLVDMDVPSPLWRRIGATATAPGDLP
jgi:hypothetical protein